MCQGLWVGVQGANALLSGFFYLLYYRFDIHDETMIDEVLGSEIDICGCI